MPVSEWKYPTRFTPNSPTRSEASARTFGKAAGRKTGSLRTGDNFALNNCKRVSAVLSKTDAAMPRNVSSYRSRAGVLGKEFKTERHCSFIGARLCADRLCYFLP